MAKANGNTPLESLPNELVLKIFDACRPEVVFRKLSKCCKRVRAVLQCRPVRLLVHLQWACDTSFPSSIKFNQYWEQTFRENGMVEWVGVCATVTTESWKQFPHLRWRQCLLDDIASTIIKPWKVEPIVVCYIDHPTCGLWEYALSHPLHMRGLRLNDLTEEMFHSLESPHVTSLDFLLFDCEHWDIDLNKLFPNLAELKVWHKSAGPCAVVLHRAPSTLRILRIDFELFGELHEDPVLSLIWRKLKNFPHLEIIDFKLEMAAKDAMYLLSNHGMQAHRIWIVMRTWDDLGIWACRCRANKVLELSVFFKHEGMDKQETNAYCTAVGWVIGDVFGSLTELRLFTYSGRDGRQACADAVKEALPLVKCIIEYGSDSDESSEEDDSNEGGGSTESDKSTESDESTETDQSTESDDDNDDD